MKMIEHNQQAKLAAGLMAASTNSGSLRSLICEGILVGDLKLTNKSDTGDDEALSKGESNS